MQVHILATPVDQLVTICTARMAFSGLPELLVDTLEASLLLWQCPSTKDRLQVHPASLDLVEAQQVLVQLRQPPLPQLDTVRESSKVGRVLEGLQEAAVVPNLCESLCEKRQEVNGISLRGKC